MGPAKKPLPIGENAHCTFLPSAWGLGIVREAAQRYRGVGWVVRLCGRKLEASRVIKFVLDVEDILLELLRGDRRRLVILLWLPVVCYGVMAFEVWLVFWAIGQPIGLVEGLTIDTFARLGSVASAAIPANIGALEASNAAVVTMLGLTGGGSLALARRVRVLLWAAVGLAVYPKPRSDRPDRSDRSEGR